MLCSVPIKVNHLNIVLLQALLCVCVWIYAWKIPFNNSSRLLCKLENVVNDCSYFWGILVNMTISCPAIKQLHDLASISVLPILNFCSGYGVLNKSLNFSGDVATLWLVYPLCSICRVHCNLSFLPISLLVRLSPDASNPQIQWQNSVLIPLDFFMLLKMVDPTLLETCLGFFSLYNWQYLLLHLHETLSSPHTLHAGSSQGWVPRPLLISFSQFVCYLFLWFHPLSKLLWFLNLHLKLGSGSRPLSKLLLVDSAWISHWQLNLKKSGINYSIVLFK